MGYGPFVWLKKEINKIIRETSMTGAGIELCNLNNVIDGRIIAANDAIPLYPFIPPVSGVYTVYVTGNTYNTEHDIYVSALDSVQSMLVNINYGINDLKNNVEDGFYVNAFRMFEDIWKDYLINPSTAHGQYLIQCARKNNAVQINSTPQTLTGKIICQKDVPTMILAYNREAEDVTFDIDNLKITYGND